MSFYWALSIEVFTRYNEIAQKKLWAGRRVFHMQCYGHIFLRDFLHFCFWFAHGLWTVPQLPWNLIWHIVLLTILLFCQGWGAKLWVLCWNQLLFQTQITIWKQRQIFLLPPYLCVNLNEKACPSSKSWHNKHGIYCERDSSFIMHQ